MDALTIFVQNHKVKYNLVHSEVETVKNEVYGGAVTLDLVIQAFFFLYLIMGGVSKKKLTSHLIYLSLHPLMQRRML